MRLQAVKREDLPEIIEITHRAMENDELFDWLNPRRKEFPGDLRRNQTIRLRERLVGIGQYGYVVVTEEGDRGWIGKPQVAGFVFLHRSAGDEASEKWRADTLFKSRSTQFAMGVCPNDVNRV